MSEEPQQQALTPFTDVGFNNPVVGASIFGLLNLSTTDMMNTGVKAKLAEVASFLNMSPDAASLVRRVLSRNNNPHVQNLDRVFEYVTMQKKRISMKNQIKNLENEIKLYE